MAVFELIPYDLFTHPAEQIYALQPFCRKQKNPRKSASSASSAFHPSEVT